ncbi:MAG: tetratricopeptide repeat protein [Planctomycetota bacterium]|jgi:tetratricopeptide (TPR) repeat protein
MPPRRLSIPALLIALAGVGCAGPDRASSPTSAGLSAVERIDRLTVEEASAPPSPVAGLPMPPGVDPAVLRGRPAGDLRARMTLETALADLTPEPSDRATVPRPTLEPDLVDEALAHYLRGREAALDERHLVAAAEFQQALDLDPDQPAVIRALARSVVALGSEGRGVELFERLLVLEPDDVEALLVTGLAAAARHDDRAAAQRLGRPFRRGGRFTHDPAADVIAADTLADVLQRLGYDQAAIDAARLTIDVPPRIDGPTRYAARFGSVFRRRGERWRSIGDAWCRLGAHDRALEAYASSAQLPTADPTALWPRVIYANLRLGRRHAAQRELLGVLAAKQSAIADREIALCAYVAAHGGDTSLLAEAVAELHARSPGQPGLVRAAATFMSRDEALALLRAFVDRRPDDLEVVTALLAWLAREDEAAAVAFVVALGDDHPDRAGDYTRCLQVAVPRPARVLELLATRPPSVARTLVECTVLGSVDAMGRAWTAVVEARRVRPDDPALARLQLEIAAVLEEPALVDAAVADVAADDTAAGWSTIAAARLALRAIDEAETAARRAVDLDPADAASLTTLARVLATRAARPDAGSDARRAAEEAVDALERAIALDPRDDDPHATLLELYGPGGVLEDADEYRAAGRRLREENPDSRLFARIIAQESVAQGRADRALERLIDLCEADPTDRESLALAVTAWSRQGALDEARRWIDERLRQRPGDPGLLEQHLRVRLLADEAEAAIDELAAELEERPDDLVTRRLLETATRAAGRSADAARLGLARLRERPPGVRRDLEMAVLHAETGEPEAARRALAAFADGAEMATYASLVRGLLLARRLEPDEPVTRLAGRLVDATIRRFPDAPLQVYGLGLLALAASGDDDERFETLAGQAVRSARGATDGSLRGALQWRQLAQELVDEDAPAAAARVLRVRIRSGAPLEPVSRSVLVMAAIVADASAGGRVEETLGLLEALDRTASLPMLPGGEEVVSMPALLYQASQIFTTVGDERGADRLLVETIRRDPTHVMAMNNLGYLRLDAGRGDSETVAWIEQAFDAEPDNANILDTVGWLRYKQGRFDADGDELGARELVEAAIAAEREPSPEVLDHLGDIWWRLGDRERALASWRRVVGLLDDEEDRQGWVDVYRLVQQRTWMLLVADAEELYHRNRGAVGIRAAAKVEAVEAGEAPSVAPTFAESSENPSGDRPPGDP